MTLKGAPDFSGILNFRILNVTVVDDSKKPKPNIFIHGKAKIVHTKNDTYQAII